MLLPKRLEQISKKYTLSVILLFALVLRIITPLLFHGQSSDEHCSILITRWVYANNFKVCNDAFLWFYYFISGSLLYLVNNAFFVTTFVTALFSLALLLVLYLIVKKIFNKKTALLTCLLLVLNAEYNLISSVPLREPVYAFFMLLSLLMILNRYFLLGAMAVGFAFLTRPEGLLIGMPLYLFCIWLANDRRESFRLSFIIGGIMIFFIIFANSWLNAPFKYLTIPLDFHNSYQAGKFVLSKFTVLSALHRCFQSIVTYGKDLYFIVGPNIIFVIIGLWSSFRLKFKDCQQKLFINYFLWQFLFWYGYIWIYGQIIFGFYRYFYTMLPFIFAFISFGFLKSIQFARPKIKYIILGVFLVNIISAWFIYFNNPGKRYLEVSKGNKVLTEAGDWLQKNICWDSENKLLIDGVAGFILYNHKYDRNIIFWVDLMEIAKNDKYAFDNSEKLSKYFYESNIHYVFWVNDNDRAVIVAPYLKEFKEVDSSYGKIVPVKKWESPPFYGYLYEFKKFHI